MKSAGITADGSTTMVRIWKAKEWNAVDEIALVNERGVPCDCTVSFATRTCGVLQAKFAEQCPAV